MKLSDWASFSEIFASIAVVITLIVLISGVRENTAITRTAMYASTLDQFNAFDIAMLSDADLQPLYARWLNSDTADLDTSDSDNVAIMVAITFRILDRAFSANENQQLGDEEWTRLNRSLCTNIGRATESGHLSVVRSLTTDSFWEYASTNCDNQAQAAL